MWKIYTCEKKESLRGIVFQIPPQNTSGFPLKRGRIKTITHSILPRKVTVTCIQNNLKINFFTTGRTIITCTYIPWVEP